ncbi:hypothetical protein M9H77_27296 [Catharanthus roseus]|uniref:Uncharacterized protein n=1 Tax=Catharanthus roseus TaxID=4058 RepID=A0ACC0AEV3_CATRO|nr:hypothetical protein M9H77_27296 [Catharanthus roseus]
MGTGDDCISIVKDIKNCSNEVRTSYLRQVYFHLLTVIVDKVNNIKYIDINGPLATEVKMKFDSSERNLCTKLKLKDIILKSKSSQPSKAWCSNALRIDRFRLSFSCLLEMIFLDSVNQFGILNTPPHAQGNHLGLERGICKIGHLCGWPNTAAE